MGLVIDEYLDLTTTDVQAFLRSNQADYEIPLTVPAGSLVAQRPIDATPLSEAPVFAWLDTYAIDRAGQSVGQTTIVTPIEQPLIVEVEFRLFVSENVNSSDLAALSLAFQNYDATSSVPPYDYMRTEVPAHIGDDHFDVLPAIRLVKSGPPVEDSRPRDALIAYWSGQVTGDFYAGNSDNYASWLREREYIVVLIDRKAIEQDPGPQENSHQIDVEDIDEDPGPHLDRLIEPEANRLDCSDVSQRVERPVATLLQWPEFMIRPTSVRIKVGCARITVRLPRLHTRTASMKLYYFYATPRIQSQWIIRQLEDCAHFAIMAGAVVGIATGNLATAIVTFKSLFTECVKQKLQDALRCFIPGLLILKSSTEWRRA